MKYGTDALGPIIYVVLVVKKEKKNDVWRNRYRFLSFAKKLGNYFFL